MAELIYQTRDVLCRRIDDQGKPMIADDLLCSVNKPPAQQLCQLESCPAVWATTPWSQVTVFIRKVASDNFKICVIIDVKRNCNS